MDSFEDEDLPESLLPFDHVYRQYCEDKIDLKRTPPSLSCFSMDKIPFDLPAELSSVLIKPYHDRFNMMDNVANLAPGGNSMCSECGLSNYGDPVILFTDAKIVTINCFILARGNPLTVT